MNKDFEFIPGALVIGGKTFPASYENLPGRVVIVAEVTEDGKKSFATIEVPENDVNYPMAYAVADETARAAVAPVQDPEPEAAPDERPETISAPEPSAPADPEPETAPEPVQEPDPEPVQDPEPETAPEPVQDPEPETAPEPAPDERPETISPDEVPETAPETAPEPSAMAPNDKAARGPAKPKDFAGEAISGNGWSIVFDTGMNRTRVIVADPLREKLSPVIEQAGFYFSRNMNSWNKRLTHKAHRAALALADSIRAALDAA